MAKYEHLQLFRDAYDLTVHLEKLAPVDQAAATAGVSIQGMGR